MTSPAPTPDELLIAARARSGIRALGGRAIDEGWPCGTCGRWHTSAAEARDYHVAEGLEAA